MSKKQNTSIQMIADFEGDIRNLIDTKVEGEIPVLATRNMVMFPGVITPLLIGRESSMKIVKKMQKDPSVIIGVFCQKQSDIEYPTYSDLYDTGVYARIIRVMEMPGERGEMTIILQGLGKCKLDSLTETKPFLKGITTPIMDVLPDTESWEFKSLMKNLHQTTAEYIKKNEDMPDESRFALKNISNDVVLVNFICANMTFSVKEKMSMLEENSLEERIYTTLRTLNKEISLFDIRNSIRDKTREDLDEQQKEYFLQQQIKNIKEELGGGDGSPEKKGLMEQAEKKNWPEEVGKVFYKELDKLDMFNPQSPEYSVQLNYLQQMVQLPWGEYTKDNLELKRAQKILDHDHYGMEKAKERILEYLAVLKLRGDLKSPIICLYGPPGVGKTSLGKSIAKAVGRKYVRIALGGMHDEAEIRGHRKTYVGALPGRILNGINKAGTSNPVMVLDEIDKLSSDFKGDPSSALLEVLDPEQNGTFHDNYLDLDYDLSHVLFITTANDISTIQPALLDRMELINVTGYLAEEKMEIAKKFLVPNELKEHGIDKKELKIDKAALTEIIDKYTHESGVRGLEKQIAKVARVTAKKIAMGDAFPPVIKKEHLKEYLGLPSAFHDKQDGNEGVGVVTGLAWTQMGGEILFVESSVSEGKGQLTMTGNLGNVMKESATIAYQYIKAHPQMAGITSKEFDAKDIHVHVPEGATPKDGPSAGITLVSSMVSALRGQAIKKGIAMTGEMTLRGRVLPVGGIKEKILAAKRAGVTTIVISEDNRKDIEDINEVYVQGLTFHYVKNIEDVIKFIFK